MPRRARKTNHKKTGGKKRVHRKGKGVIDWIKEKAGKVNNFLKEKRIVHNIRSLPIIGSALNLWGIPGVAAWGLDKLGYGRMRRDRKSVV